MVIRRSALFVVLFVIAAACGSTAGSPDSVSQAVSAPDCVPDAGLVVEPLTGEDQRLENIEDYLTGYRLEDFPEDQEPPNADPNWGGIWGDSVGGVVVAVLDCSVVDVNQVARLAGPEGVLRIIEVPYTFVEVTEFSDSFRAQLEAAGIDGGTRIDSTLTGRHLEVRVRDVDALPEDFGRDIPEDAYSIVETEDFPGHE